MPRSAPEEPAQAVSEPARPEALDVIVAAFMALAYAISARALLLLSIVGAFVLAVIAATSDRIGAAVVLGVYGVFVVVPVCILEYRRREA